MDSLSLSLSLSSSILVAAIRLFQERPGRAKSTNGEPSFPLVISFVTGAPHVSNGFILLWMPTGYAGKGPVSSLILVPRLVVY